MHLPGPELPRFAVVIAVLTLVLIVLGAIAGAAGPDSGLRNSLVNGRAHLVLAVLVGSATILLAMWLAPANVPAWVRATGWIAVGLFAVDSAIMTTTPAPPVDPSLAVPHAIVAPLFLAALAVIAFFTPQDWINGPTQIDYAAMPSLRLAALTAPLLVILQIAMGALYRHKIFGVMPHMAGAMLVTLVLLVLSVVLLQNYPGHPTLRPIAIATMSVLLLQVALGIGAFVMRLLDFDTAPAFLYLAAAHVTLGSLTLASSVVLWLEVRRCDLSARPSAFF